MVAVERRGVMIFPGSKADEEEKNSPYKGQVFVY
jgi:hypothetical protein